MGQLYTRLGTNNRNTQIQKWIQSDWCLTVNENEVAHQVLSRKRESEQLETETRKRKCLEQRVADLESKVQEQQKIIGEQRSYLKKPIEDCTRQHQLTRRKKIFGQVTDYLRAEGYDPCSLEVRNQAGHSETYDLSSEKLSRTKTVFTSDYNKVRSSY